MNTFTLKMTALILMVLDHIGCYFDGAPVWLNWLGRLSYPLFLFCMVQGYRHTRNRKRYLLRLYLMSLFMTGFSYFLDSRFPTPNGYGNHNIFLPMLLTGVLISTIECFGREDSFPVRTAMRTAHGINAARCPLPAGCPLVQARRASSGRIAQKDRRKGFFLLGGLFGVQLLYYVLPFSRHLSGDLVTGVIPNLDVNEYGFAFIALGVLMYFLWEKKELFTVVYLIFCVWQFSAEGASGAQWLMAAALPLMLRYNDQKGPGLKYFFYFFYPAHTFLLFWLANFVF